MKVLIQFFLTSIYICHIFPTQEISKRISYTLPNYLKGLKTSCWDNRGLTILTSRRTVKIWQEHDAQGVIRHLRRLKFLCLEPEP